MIQPLRDLQLFRNSDVETLTTYADTVCRMASMVSNDQGGTFKDGQIVLGRFRDGQKIRTVTGTVSISGNSKYIDFLTVKDDINSAIEAALENLDGSATIAQLNNGTLTIKEVVQSDGAIDDGNTLVTLYLDTEMSSTNPLVSSSTVDSKVAAERAKDYINSAQYESGNPLKLTAEEINELRQVYRVGHIVHDVNTNRFYAWYGNAWGYPTVEITSTQTMAQFVTNRELLILNNEPIHLEGGTIKSISYAPVYGQPSDWATNWDKYYLWDSNEDEYYLNDSDVYDSTKAYHVKNIITI